MVDIVCHSEQFTVEALRLFVVVVRHGLGNVLAKLEAGDLVE